MNYGSVNADFIISSPLKVRTPVTETDELKLWSLSWAILDIFLVQLVSISLKYRQDQCAFKTFTQTNGTACFVTSFVILQDNKSGKNTVYSDKKSIVFYQNIQRAKDTSCLKQRSILCKQFSFCEVH